MENKLLEDSRTDRQQGRKKFKLSTLGGTLIATAAVAAQLFIGAVVEPLDAGYVFTSNDVTISNPSDDYHSNQYKVIDSNGVMNNFSFEELESIEPSVHGGYTFIPSGDLSSGSYLGIMRVESNPVRAVLNGTALATLIAGGVFVGHSLSEDKKTKRSRQTFNIDGNDYRVDIISPVDFDTNISKDNISKIITLALSGALALGAMTATVNLLSSSSTKADVEMMHENSVTFTIPADITGDDEITVTVLPDGTAYIGEDRAEFYNGMRAEELVLKASSEGKLYRSTDSLGKKI